LLHSLHVRLPLTDLCECASVDMQCLLLHNLFVFEKLSAQCSCVHWVGMSDYPQKHVGHHGNHADVTQWLLNSVFFECIPLRAVMLPSQGAEIATKPFK